MQKHATNMRGRSLELTRIYIIVACKVTSGWIELDSLIVKINSIIDWPMPPS